MEFCSLQLSHSFGSIKEWVLIQKLILSLKTSSLRMIKTINQLKNINLEKKSLNLIWITLMKWIQNKIIYNLRQINLQILVMKNLTDYSIKTQDLRWTLIKFKSFLKTLNEKNLLIGLLKNLPWKSKIWVRLVQALGHLQRPQFKIMHTRFTKMIRLFMTFQSSN